MKIAVISTGNELLKGTTVNSNLALIGKALSTCGMGVAKAFICGDELDDLQTTLTAALTDFDIIITTGGLGPTTDDLTKQAICNVLGLELKQDPKLAKKLTQDWEAKGYSVGLDEVLIQANIPGSTTPIPNEIGSAPGLWVMTPYKSKDVIIAALPGPPVELKPMLDTFVLPHLKHLPINTQHTRTFMIAGALEVLVQQKIKSIVADSNVTVAYCASVEGVRVFISGDCPEEVFRCYKDSKRAFSTQVINDNAASLVEDVVELLKANQLTLAVAESCTGGLIGSKLTEIAGVSEIFKGGVISYADSAKEKLLEVDPTILKKHGAVSATCADAMVKGVSEAFDTPAAIAVTGIAGPEGGSKEKPVGLVYIGAKLQDQIIVGKCQLQGDREAIRQRAAAMALLELRDLLIRH